MRRGLLAILLFLSCLCPAISAETRALDVHVVRILDGDTIEVVDSNKLDHRIRLAGIDAPEQSQAFSERARQHLAALVHNKDVRISWSKKDQYGRMVAKVTLEDSTDVNLSLIAAGLAWHYKEYEREQSAVDRRAYASAEQTARSARHGLWAEADPVAPWDWRHTPKSGPVKKSRNDICHAPSMPTYPSVKNFIPYDTLEECIESGGRPPKGSAD